MATLLIIGACTTAGQALATRWARWAGHANDGLVLVDREAPAALCAALAPRAAIAETMPHDWRAALRTWRPDFVLDCAGIAAEWPTAPDGFRAPPGRWLWLTADRKAALPRPGWATPIYLDQVYDPADVARGALAQILDAFLDGRRVPVYGDGSETSDWLHADDFARGIGFAFQQARAGESFDLRSGEVVSRLELLTIAARVVDARFRDEPWRAKAFPRCPASLGKACANLLTFVRDRREQSREMPITGIARPHGFTPRIKLADGLAQALDVAMDEATVGYPFGFASSA
jgi:hypothetical protein